MGMFRWGMGGGYGRPFFSTVPRSMRFPAVTVAMPAKRCEAVSSLKRNRILAMHAPTLPMPKCSMPGECRCKFQKYTDRREDDQGRRFSFGRERGAWYAGSHRRNSPGRRSAD